MPNKFFVKAVSSANMADNMDQNELQKIGHRIVDAYQHDKQSRSEWEEVADESLELANMKYETKVEPWENAANIKFPLISRAAIQFSANTVNEIIRRDKAVQTKVIGMDPEGMKEARAKRIEDFMNYQLVYKNDDWITSIDRALQYLGIIGIVFRKIYYDPITRENKVELCTHKEVVVHYDIPSLEKSRRITHLQKLHTNTLVEHMRKGLFLDLKPDELKVDSDNPDETIHDILEQHCYLDLDKDGYEEPYIVTVHEETNKVLRIVPRYDLEGIEYNDKDQVAHIEPIHYFSDMHCIPAFDGGYYSIGFGALLHSLNHTVNTGLNQLIDAGTLANTQSGFISKGLALRSGEIKFKPGYFHKVDGMVDADLRRGLYQLQFKEPSGTLFQLMNLLNETAREISSTTDAMMGNNQTAGTKATTTMSQVERGLKVYNSIQKRIFRALNKEFRMYYALNRRYLDQVEYANVLDDPEAILENDFEDETIDVLTVADPELSSDVQRLMQAQLIMDTTSFPEVNRVEALKRLYESAHVDNLEQLIPVGEQQPTPEEQAKNMELQLKAQELQLKERELAVKEAELQIKAMEEQRHTEEDQHNMAKDAAEVELRQQEQMIKAAMEANKQRTEIEKELIKQRGKSSERKQS